MQKNNVQTYSSEKAPVTEALQRPSTSHDITFGGFFAFSAVIQDARAALLGNGTLTAHKDVTILSNSDSVVINKADSSHDPASTIRSQMTKQLADVIASLLGIIKGVFATDSLEAGYAPGKLDRIKAFFHPHGSSCFGRRPCGCGTAHSERPGSGS